MKIISIIRQPKVKKTIRLLSKASSKKFSVKRLLTLAKKLLRNRLNKAKAEMTRDRHTATLLKRDRKRLKKNRKAMHKDREQFAATHVMNRRNRMKYQFVRNRRALKS